MTDREKLDEIINLINKYNQSDSVHRKGYGQVLQLMFTRYPLDRRDWHPSSRPCFDKPAGTPIEHWETV